MYRKPIFNFESISYTKKKDSPFFLLTSKNNTKVKKNINNAFLSLPASNIRAVSQASHWLPTVSWLHLRLLQKDAELQVCSRRSNRRCVWQLHLTRHRRPQSELQSRMAEKTSTWSPASASGTGRRSGRSTRFEQNLERHKETTDVRIVQECQEYTKCMSGLSNLMNITKIISILIRLHQTVYIYT